jgi:ADP-heptose:LPS heptosyltransferase
LPSEVIAQVHQQLAAQGVTAQVLLLEGEQVEVPRSVGLVRVPRQFSALMASLREADIVVSADSLPAHVGEHLGKPTFVISPAPNPYWLPRAAFLQGGHGVFGNLGNLDTWLERL